ncbi:hypothetical protein HY78_18055 [Rhizorhabdus wittichii DC-6]|nr:hypothetical protein HY78_18055 [Rhizorhabdus wittichii DC-6]
MKKLRKKGSGLGGRFMARKHGSKGPNQLSAIEARNLSKEPGLHTDGGGLYLRVGKDGRQCSWLAIYHFHGRRREMGLGSYDKVSLKRAREKAADVRAQVADGIDPIAVRKSKKTMPTFGDLADEWIKKKSANVRGRKSIPRYKRALGEEGYAKALRAMRIDTVTGEDVLAVIQPIWVDRLTTAKTLRTYLFDVFDIAKARKYRIGENPAAWEGLLKAELELESSSRVSKKHHAAMPWRDIRGFVEKLRSRSGLPARALEFLIRNANRTTEVLEMKVGEVELGRKPVWTIPGDRMKSGRQHEIRLSKRSVEMLKHVDRRAKRTPLAG